jgi:uncharacterized protein YdaU (DUF1376 family)
MPSQYHRAAEVTRKLAVMSDGIDIWMPLYIGDYLSDTADLTAEQHGCYLLLLMHEWKNGPLPGDVESLAMIAHLGASRTRKQTVNFILERYFSCHEDSNSAHTYTQKRLEAERQKSIEKQRFFEERASKGGRAKAALSSASSNAISTPQAVLEGVLETCTARPLSPSPSDIKRAPNRSVAEIQSDSALSTADAADRRPPFFTNVVLTPAEATAKWSASTYVDFWNDHVSTEAGLTTISQKWVQVIEDFQDRRGLTPATFLEALKQTEHRKPIQSSTDFFDAVNSAVRGRASAD